MIQMTGDTRPKCFKCEDYALTIFNSKWLCGPCFVKVHQKIQEFNDKFLMEE